MKKLRYVQRDWVITTGFRSLWRLVECTSRLAGNVADALLQTRERKGLFSRGPLKNQSSPGGKGPQQIGWSNLLWAREPR